MTTSPAASTEQTNTDELHIIARFCDDMPTIQKTAKLLLLSRGEIPSDQRRDYYQIIAIADHFNNKKSDGNLQKITARFKNEPFTLNELTDLQTEIDQRIKDLSAIQREKDEQARKNAEIESARIAPLNPVDDYDITDINVENVFLDAFHVNSSSCDDNIARIILLAFMGGRELTGDGLHCNVNAPPGSGKSIATSAAVHALPEAPVYTGAMTDHAVLYDPALQPGTLIKTDEAQARSEALENIIKEAVSSFQAGILYRTVQKVENQNQTIIKRLPPRLTFITASVNVQGSDQIRSRFLPLAPVERTNTINALVTEFRLNKRENAIPKLHTNETIEKSRKVLQHFMRRTFKARIPKAAKTIEYNLKGDQRAQEWLENALLYHAVLNYKKRPHQTDENGVIVVDVTKDDFDKVIELPIFKYSAALDKRLTDEEKGYIEKLQPFKGKIVSNQQLAADIFGVSGGRVTQIMKGRPDRNQDGLIHHFAIEEVSVFETDTTRTELIKTNRKGYKIPDNLPDIRRTEIGKTAENHIAEWKNTPATTKPEKPAVKSPAKEPETQNKSPETPDFLKRSGLER